MSKRFLPVLFSILALTVFAFAQTGDLHGTVFLPMPQGPAAGATVMIHLDQPGSDTLTTTTDSMGHYEFEDIPVGGYHARASFDGYMDGFGFVGVQPNHNSHLDLFLGPNMDQVGSITGTVFLPDGQTGAAGAEVTVRTEMGGGIVFNTVADDQGQFSFTDIPALPYQATATLEGYFDGHGFVIVFPDQTVPLVLILGPSVEDAGAVSGTVTTDSGDVAANATVLLDRLDWQHPGFHGVTVTDAQGAFSFDTVPAGSYMVTAMLFGAGFASAPIEVLANQTTNVTLVLENRHDHGGHHGGGHGEHGEHEGDSLTVVDLAGVAMVIPADSTHHHTRYLLDVNADGVADYRLAFGPDWYDPDGEGQGAERPQDGDQITIHGGLLSFGETPIVVVYEINGLFWREPNHGHGGNGGWHGQGCDPDSVVSIDLEGTAIVQDSAGFHDPMHRYAIDINNDTEADYVLSFGPPWYDPDGPGQGAERPADGDAITIVGGLIVCDDTTHLGIVIVYEINGLPWRDPGDTTGFSPDTPTGIDPVIIGAPSSYLTASNYPNPFNPTTMINYSLPVNGEVTLKVFDITGREVATLINGYQPAGSYRLTWNAASMPSGIYFYRVTVADKSFTNRMVLIK
jgi:hypothetical protein